MAPSADQTPATALKQHMVYFYESEIALLSALTVFIGDGLRDGDVCIVLSTREHHESLLEQLKRNGLNVPAAYTQDAYIWMDAAEILSQFMVAGMPEPELFTAVVGSPIAQAIQRQRHVRVFGEIVTVLWSQGNHAAAMRLEEFGNELSAQFQDTSLFCAYPMHFFEGHIFGRDFLNICQKHSHIISVDGSVSHAGRVGQLETIPLVQSEATLFEAELEQRKEAERLLRLSKEEQPLLAAIVESSNDVIVSKTLEGIITSWNAAAERLFGYSADEAIGKHITLIIPPELQWEEEQIISNLRQGKRIEHFETVRVKKDGTRVDVSLSISPVRDRTGKVIGASKIARDISERRALERRKDEFIGMASHELKTPMTSLKGFTDLLRRRLTNAGDEQSLHFLVRMDAQINRLTSLVNDLLSITQMQKGELEYRMEVFDLAELVRETVENIQGATQTHHLLLQEATAASVYGDRDRIGQVLTNLLTNAIRYSRNADQVMIGMSAQGGNALVSVQDFGIGIAQEYQQQIFERFFHVSDPEEKTYPGLGIGLYISWQIIERHQGRLSVQSRKGEGSTFSFSLPLVQNEDRETEEKV